MAILALFDKGIFEVVCITNVHVIVYDKLIFYAFVWKVIELFCRFTMEKKKMMDEAPRQGSGGGRKQLPMMFKLFVDD